MKRHIAISACLGLLLALPGLAEEPAGTAPEARRSLEPADQFRIKEVSDPQLSLDGKWIAYTVETVEPQEEKSWTQVFMSPAASWEPIPMTAKGQSSSRPRFSPDGKYLAFLSARGEDRAQVWLLDRRGGEAQQATEVTQGVQSFDWSPDGKRLVLVIKDATPLEQKAEKEKKEGVKSTRPETQPPWVVDRLQAKRDYEGYLDRRRTHLYVFDPAAKKVVQVTSGDYDDSEPAWSPDGRLLAFTSNRSAEPDASYDTNLWVVAADNPDQGKTMLQVTTNPGPDRAPAWSPDGRTLAYETQTDVKLFYYATTYLAISPAAGGEARLLTRTLDRNVSRPRYSPDGKSIWFILEDSAEQHLANIPAGESGDTTPISREGKRAPGSPPAGIGIVSPSSRHAVEDFTLAGDGSIAALLSEPSLPPEVFVLRGGEPRRLTAVNDEFLKQVRLAEVEEAHFKSKDGTEIEGLTYKPAGFAPGLRYPAILWIHGGPVSQFAHRFQFFPQLFAANGCVVVTVNPRGSSGYGQDFSAAIFAAWGQKDYEDVMAGVDHAIAQGYADPDRLGIGGWSYGGMLTNYTITQTTRFKGAVSGASLGLAAGNYGHDHYQRDWELELGLPWRNREVWDRVSAFWKVEKITTPTLWMCGEKDWNVPAVNSEQMYQAMKRLGRDTEMVIYPGEHHGISKPSYQLDRLNRFLAWYERWVKGVAPAVSRP